MKMKRAIRRHYSALLKSKLQSKIEDINQWYSTPDQAVNADKEAKRQRAMRRIYRDEGKRSHWKCGCEWCIENWRYSKIREENRMLDEEKDFMSFGRYPTYWCWDFFCTSEKEYNSFWEEWNDWLDIEREW